MRRFKLIFSLVFSCSSLSLLTGCSKKCTVSFNTNGGTPVESIVVKEGSKINIPSTFKNGYEVAKWTCGRRVWDFSNDKVSEDMTLKADWDAVIYSITYHLDGGHLPGYETNPETYTIEDEFDFVFPIKNHYKSTSWRIGSEQGESITEINKGNTGDLDLYPVYDTNAQHTLSYSCDIVCGEAYINGESFPATSTTSQFDYGDIINLKAVPRGDKYDNYGVWVGWYNTTDDILISSETECEFVMPDKDVAIYPTYSL